MGPGGAGGPPGTPPGLLLLPTPPPPPPCEAAVIAWLRAQRVRSAHLRSRHRVCSPVHSRDDRRGEGCSIDLAIVLLRLRSKVTKVGVDLSKARDCLVRHLVVDVSGDNDVMGAEGRNVDLGDSVADKAVVACASVLEQLGKALVVLVPSEGVGGVSARRPAMSTRPSARLLTRRSQGTPEEERASREHRSFE